MVRGAWRESLLIGSVEGGDKGFDELVHDGLVCAQILGVAEVLALDTIQEQGDVVAGVASAGGRCGRKCVGGCRICGGSGFGDGDDGIWYGGGNVGGVNVGGGGDLALMAVVEGDAIKEVDIIISEHEHHVGLDGDAQHTAKFEDPLEGDILHLAGEYVADGVVGRTGLGGQGSLGDAALLAELPEDLPGLAGVEVIGLQRLCHEKTPPVCTMKTAKLLTLRTGLTDVI
nr:MAG TPA_asm: hypothetical protein [Caudoviricetes sp.]